MAGLYLIQPPEIRHRVLESSANLQVIEVGVPAEHITTMDHEMQLPTPVHRPDRWFGGQRFCLSRAEEAVWTPSRMSGFQARETGVSAATRGVASVRLVRPAQPSTNEWTSHNADILFTFVQSGSMTLRGHGASLHRLREGDAYVIPPDLKAALDDCSKDLQLLEVALPGEFETTSHPFKP